MIDKELARCALKTIESMPNKQYDMVPRALVNSLLPWVVIPPRGDDEVIIDRAGVEDLLCMSRDEVARKYFMAGPSRFYSNRAPLMRQISDDVLFEIVRLASQNAINHYKAQQENEQAVRT